MCRYNSNLTSEKIQSIDIPRSNLFSRKYGLDDNTIDFIGHAVALHRDDNYLSEPALDTVKRMKASLIPKDKNIP